MKKNLIVLLLSLTLNACAIKHEPAPIIYNHKGSNINHSETYDRGLATVIDQDGNIQNGASENLRGSDELQYGQEDIIDPAINEAINDDENYITPEQRPIEHSQIEHSQIGQSKKTLYHEVQPGETLEDIAVSYEQTTQEIGRLNNLSLPYEVEPYQSLKIIVPQSFVRPTNITKSTDNRHLANTPQASYIQPVKGEVIARFGDATSYGKNKGINIAAKVGTKVRASASGRVIYSDYDGTFGNLIIIKVDGKNTVTAYAHLEDLILSKGAKVGQGDIVGYVGKTGKVDKPQLHFAIREGKNAVDPLKFVEY